MTPRVSERVSHGPPATHSAPSQHARAFLSRINSTSASGQTHLANPLERPLVRLVRQQHRKVAARAPGDPRQTPSRRTAAPRAIRVRPCRSRSAARSHLAAPAARATPSKTGCRSLQQHGDRPTQVRHDERDIRITGRESARDQVQRHQRVLERRTDRTAQPEVVHQRRQGAVASRMKQHHRVAPIELFVSGRKSSSTTARPSTEQWMFTPAMPSSSRPRRSSRNDASTCGSGSDTSALKRSGLRLASAAVVSLAIRAASIANGFVGGVRRPTGRRREHLHAHAGLVHHLQPRLDVRLVVGHRAAAAEPAAAPARAAAREPARIRRGW